MLLKKFQRYVQEHNICTHDDKILLAVSGGVDSMVMLSLFSRSGYDIGVAHCNFQLRGAESDEDDVVVQKAAEQCGVPFYLTRFDTTGEMAATGESMEMAARRLRYAWFEQLCREYGYTRIAIAHHADDSVETFFINLLRGTGLRGLTGIKVINGRIIRPLLFSLRRDIIDYALSEKIPYREDSSNASTKYLRNKIRLGVIPRIKEISPRFTDTMTATVERLTAAQRFIDRGIDIIRQEVQLWEGDRCVIDLTQIDSHLPMQFVIFELMRELGFHGEVIDSLYRSLTDSGSGKRFYSKDRVAYLDRDRIIVTPIPEDDICSLEVTPETTRIYCGGGVITFEHIEPDDVESFRQPAGVALLDEGKLTYPLTVRRWQEGDTFIPFGMTGRKKVSDFLIDQKIALPDKRTQFVVVSGSDIVWIVGQRIDDRFQIGAATRKVLRLIKETDSGI